MEEKDEKGGVGLRSRRKRRKSNRIAVVYVTLHRLIWGRLRTDLRTTTTTTTSSNTLRRPRPTYVLKSIPSTFVSRQEEDRKGGDGEMEKGIYDSIPSQPIYGTYVPTVWADSQLTHIVRPHHKSHITSICCITTSRRIEREGWRKEERARTGEMEKGRYESTLSQPIYGLTQG